MATTITTTPTALLPEMRVSQVLSLKPRNGFATTPFVDEIIERAMAYVQAGFAIHFCGPSGSGKTTLALHLANQLAQPMMLVTGDDQFGTSDLVGGQFGYRKRKVVDNFVHSVLKVEEDMSQRWADSRLTIACREGFTLVYDEFTRSRPEANNVMLSVLEEKLLVLPTMRTGSNNYLKVHPNFIAIFTSNPEDYAGVHKTQDALRDRMITIYLDYFDRETEVAITSNRSELDIEQAGQIVDLVRAFRDHAEVPGVKPTVRAAIMIARTVSQRQLPINIENEYFLQICFDILGGGLVRGGAIVPLEIRQQHRKLIRELVAEHCWR